MENAMSVQVDFTDLQQTLQELIERVSNPPWSLTITRVDNGYVLSGTDTHDVIEDDDSDELKSHEALLWSVMEYFDFGGCKHDKERIRVVREKQ